MSWRRSRPAAGPETWNQPWRSYWPSWENSDSSNSLFLALIVHQDLLDLRLDPRYVSLNDVPHNL